jgi:hypothetical protein
VTLARIETLAQGGSDDYVGINQVMRELPKLLDDQRRLDGLLENVAGKYGVAAGGPSTSTGVTVGRGIAVVDAFFVNRMAQRYGVEGRQPLRPPGWIPRIDPNEVRRDLTMLQGFEAQAEKFGSARQEITQKLSAIRQKVLDVQRTQYETDVPGQLADLQTAAGSMTNPEEIDGHIADLKRLATDIVTNEREMELIGSGRGIPIELLNKINSTSMVLSNKKAGLVPR